MSFEQKPNSGSLWRNKEKKNDSDPSATGSVLIGGNEFWVSAWTNTTKNGEKYQMLRFREKESKDQAASKSQAKRLAVQRQMATTDVNDPDDIPF